MMALKRDTAGDGQQACCVLWEEAQTMREQSRQHHGREHTPLLRRSEGVTSSTAEPGWRRVQDRRMAEQMVTRRAVHLNPSRPCCQPCSQLSFEGQRHHFANRFAHALPPLPTRKRRRRRRHRHHHPQSLMRVNKQFTTSYQTFSIPPSCSYKTFLVRHPAALIL